MPKCSEGTCSCIIHAGPGITVVGNGTPSNPFRVSLEAITAGPGFEVEDSQTVNLTLIGSGLENDPVRLRAEATVRMTDLVDFDDPQGAPQAGDSPVWIIPTAGGPGHFEMRPPVPSPPGAVNVGPGIDGSGSAASPIRVRTTGADGGPTSGNEVYVDSAGGLRAKPQAVPELPSGVVVVTAAANAPTGWLLCDGRAVSRTTYAALFAAIGTTYGAGDGTTTFALPNLKGRVPVGIDAAQTEFNTRGETGGEKAHTLTIDEMPSHSHPGKHRYVAPVPYSSSVNVLIHAFANSLSPNVNGHPQGGGKAHNNLQPYIAMNYIIKV